MNIIPGFKTAGSIAFSMLLAACQTCETLDSLPLGKEIVVGPLGTPGNSYQPPTMDIWVSPFTTKWGGTVSNGFAKIDNRSLAGGPGNDMAVNNTLACISVGFGQQLHSLRLSFGEYGGTINVRINNALVAVDDFSQLQGTTVGGVQVNVLSGGGGNDKGQVEFTGMMNDQGSFGQFAIGGQELWIDDICYTK